MMSSIARSTNKRLPSWSCFTLRPTVRFDRPNPAEQSLRNFRIETGRISNLRGLPYTMGFETTSMCYNLSFRILSGNNWLSSAVVDFLTHNPLIQMFLYSRALIPMSPFFTTEGKGISLMTAIIAIVILQIAHSRWISRAMTCLGEWERFESRSRNSRTDVPKIINLNAST